MIIQLEDYKDGESRAFEIQLEHPPDIISYVGNFWIWSIAIIDEGKEFNIYIRASKLEIETL